MTTTPLPPIGSPALASSSASASSPAALAGAAAAPLQQAEVLRLLPRGLHGAALLGPPRSGKTSLAFQVAYALAAQFPDRQAVFIHCRGDGQEVARAVRPVVRTAAAAAGDPQGGEEEEQPPQGQGHEAAGGEWDYGTLENVFLKRFTAAQHLLWYFGSLHNQPDALLPGALVVDDLPRFRSLGGHDPAATCAQVLSVLRDAADHIARRTGRPCWTLVTAEADDMQQQQAQALRRLTPVFLRQLGAVLRVRRDDGTRGRGQGNRGGEAFVLEEDREAAHVAATALGRGGGGGGGKGLGEKDRCRFALEPKVLRVLVGPS